MNPRLIGGEMLRWSDLSIGDGPGPVRGAVFGPLLETVGGRILVAGPHHPELLDALPPGDLTLLVRGVPDAEELAARYADRPGVVVCCGTPEKLAGEAPYDTVIALDGLGRLSSVEEEQLGWAATAEVLIGLLRPGGRLLLGVENYLGLHRLVAMPPEVQDADWTPVGEYDETRPAGLDRVLARLDGLRVVRTYAAFPEPAWPTALLGTELLADERIRGFVEAALDGAFPRIGNPLVDPRPIAVDARRHGLAAELAPAWVLLAERPGPVAEAAPAVPCGVIATAASLSVVRRGGEGGWARTPLPVGMPRDVPEGRTVKELVLGAAQNRDLPAVRALLEAWQSGPAAGLDAAKAIVAPDGAVVPSGLAVAGMPEDALLSLATAILGSGLAHPWPTVDGAPGLARTLAAMTGRDLTIEDEAGNDPAQSLRELLLERDRLEGELAQARAKAKWYEKTLTDRENALARAQRLVELLSDSGAARLGKAFMGGAKVARRSARVVVRRIRPRD
jgi:hypothetical protein